MTHRREFLQSSLIGSISLLWTPRASAAKGLSFELSRQVPTRMYDGKKCWCHPRAGIVPPRDAGKPPRVVMTMNTLHVDGSDVFKGVFGLETDDLGKTWTEPRAIEPLAPRYETIGGQRRPVAVSDFWPTWHDSTRSLLGTGHTVVYTPDWKVARPRPRHTSYSVYDASTGDWSRWKKLVMPGGERFGDAGAGCVQRYDEADGDILLPVYFREPGSKTSTSRVVVTRCAFDGQTLSVKELGNVLSKVDKTRGLHEPSLTRFGDRYYLTIRNDRQGFITTSDDGLHFDPIQPWKFDDGEELGNYNTQQHWVTHSEGLFLAYTRRGANNDHVFRHRAPLFIAEVDPERLRVVRSTEQVLVPERGARLGNFGVTRVSEHETWVTVAEWMQTWGPNHIMPVDNKYGADGSVYVARIRWNRPNRT